MNNTEMMNYIRHRMEQAEASMATFVANNDAREVLRLLERYTKMNRSTDPRKMLNGTLASYGLMRGIMAHLEGGGWSEGDGGK
jgi:type VI protein secretion system component VasK